MNINALLFRLSVFVVKWPLSILNKIPGPEVIKLLSSSTQLSMKFQVLINVEIVKNCGKFRFTTQKLVIYPANKC